MAKIIAKDNGGGDFELPEAGSYPARCYRMLEIGHIQAFPDDKYKTPKVILGFELSTATAEFKAGEGEKPFTVNIEFTLSTAKKANLRKFLQDWRGKDYENEEAAEVELTKLIGQPGRVTIKHKPNKKDEKKFFLDIAGISKMMKDEVKSLPPLFNKSEVLAFDEFDWDLLAKLPDWIQNKIKSSDEYNELVGQGKAPSGKVPVPAPIGADDEDNDLPF